MDSQLALLRKDRKMSRAFVARSLGLDETAVYLWEIGKRQPNGKNLLGLAKLYEMEPAVLLGVIERQRSGAGDGE